MVVDQRCHGLSSQVEGFRPPHTLGASATDVAQLFRSQFGGHAPNMVIGHSLGGKVALEYLRQRACGLNLPRQARRFLVSPLPQLSDWCLTGTPLQSPEGLLLLGQYRV